MLSNKVAEFERMGHDYPYRSFGQQPNGGQMSVMAWNAMQTEVSDNRCTTFSPHSPSTCPSNSFHEIIIC